MGKLRIAAIRDEFLRAFQPLECRVEEAEFLGQTRLILSISHAHKVVLQVQSIPIQKIAEPRRFAVFVKEARNRLEASRFLARRLDAAVEAHGKAIKLPTGSVGTWVLHLSVVQID